MRIIGIDPGEVWCGFALLEWDEGHQELRSEARVFHIPPRGMKRTVYDALFGLPARVVVENYAQRPTGFNSFSQGTTLRLLGALEFYTGQSRGSEFFLVPPGNADKELPLLAEGFFDAWADHWLHAKNKNWNHARSAWRVLLRHVMEHEPTVMQALRDKRTCESLTAMKSPLYSSVRVEQRDLFAIPGRWKVPRKYRL
jgi:hypothetical protein